MQRNFKVEQGIALKTATENFDIWNIYQLESISLHRKDNRLDCLFQKAWQHDAPDLGAALRLSFHNIEFLSVQCYGEIEDVAEIGFKARTDNDLDWLCQEGQQDEADDLILRLSPSGHIRVKAEHADIVRISHE